MAELHDATSLSAAGLPLPKNWLAIIAFIWAGQAASMITSYAAGYAVVWYVTESTGSALMLAAMNIAVMLPVGLISPFGGIVADKHNRKLIMIAADGAVGVISLVAGVFILAGDVSIPLLLAVCIARAVGQAFHSPAMMAAMPMLVPDKHLLRINTLDQLLGSVASIGAPAFGIFLYTTLGFSSVMFLDFAGACVAILGLALAKIPTVVDATAEGQHVLANLRDGWRAIAKTRGLVLLIGGVTVGMMIFGPLSAVFPLMTYQHFGGDGYAASLAEAATPPIAMPIGVASPMAAVSRPMARPILSSGTLRWVSVMVGPLNQAQATAMTATRTMKAGKASGGKNPQAAVAAPTMTAATAMSPARRLPPPQAMRTPEPTSMPTPKAASARDAA